MKISLNIELELEALPYPQPLPLEALQTEFAMRQQALNVLLHSNAFLPVAKSMLAEWIITDGGVTLAQALAEGVVPRDSHLMLAALNAGQDTLAAWIIEHYVRRGSVTELMKDVSSRVRFGRIDVTHARIDSDDGTLEAAGAFHANRRASQGR